MRLPVAPLLFLVSLLVAPAMALADAGHVHQSRIYDPGQLQPTASMLNVREGELAPDFTLPSLDGEQVRLSDFRGKKNVVLSFVPAAFTPICSDQWPGYNLAKSLFDQHDATLLGITVDNIPTLYAWTREMGDIWFHVLSDFWPHGAVAAQYGVLRPEGVSERALFVIDKQGYIRWAHVNDINTRPDLKLLADALKGLGE